MRLSRPQTQIYDMVKFSEGNVAGICGSMLIQGQRDTQLLKQAVQTMYRTNDALRIRIMETAHGVEQEITDFSYEPEILRFDDKAKFHAYADSRAKEYVDMYGSLCEIQIIVLPDSYGILVKAHHIISDAWTLSLIASQFYALAHGESPEAFSYAYYIEREDSYVQSPRFAKDNEFFMEQFRNCDEIIYLSNKTATTNKSQRKTFVIDKDSAEIINSYIKTTQTSAFSLFMTLLATYICRTNIDVKKIYIGTAVLNRFGAKEKNTMGMFINSVPLLVEIDREKTFSENIAAVQERAFAAFRHQKCHYADILSKLRKDYSFTEKLYDVTFSYQNATIAGSSDKFESVWHHNGAQTESLQVHVDDRDNEGIFRVHFDYQTEKFTERDMERMYERMMNLLFDAIRHEEKRVFELEILSPMEKQKLLQDFNATDVDYPRDSCVHTLFEEQAARTPDKTAVIACDATLTYEQLNMMANRIAHGLIAMGIRNDDIVAFALPRKSCLIAVIFGILKSGAAYLPIDPDYPAERVKYMLDDSQAKVFITEKSLPDLIKNKCESNPEVIVPSESLCYCIYTSGTTGNPKGVLISHRNVINFCNPNIYNKHSVLIGGNSWLLSTFKPVFDAFTVDYALFLTTGNSIYLAKDNEITNPKYLSFIINTKNINVIHTTPSIVATLTSSNDYSKSLQKINLLIIAAEKFTPKIYQIISPYTDAIILNGYGPTETTIGVSYCEIKDSNAIPIGKPIANTKIYIVDRQMRPMPIGCVGELCIAGDCVGAGYLNRPELTAEKFIDNPFGEGKLYKSGDLAFWREDGNLVYVGRKDFQVKVRGLRIEPGEIEQTISGLDGVDGAVVVARPDDTGRQMLCAFYTGIKKDGGDIRSAIGKRLPLYMLPNSFTHLDAFPLTASGKVDRKALPEVDFAHSSPAAEYVAPETKEEKALASCVAIVLGVEQVGMLDSFFDLGGDSLKVIELILQLEKAGYNSDVKTVFASATLKELAGHLEQACQQQQAEKVDGDIPATAAQMRVYTHQNRLGQSSMYNIPCLLQVKSLNPERLEQAATILIKRHEMLRTRFENRDGVIMQIVERDVPFSLERLSSGDMSAFVRPFDLSQAPLLRIGYYQDKILIDTHHMVNDGISMEVFLHELNDAYMGRTLPEPEATYRQFSLQDSYSKEDEDYWLAVHEGDLPVLELNADFRRGQKRSFNGATIYATIDMDLHDGITSLCREVNITPHVCYMAAFSIMLSKFSGNEDMIIGVPVSGREGRFLDVIGMFVNTIAMRCKPEGDKSVRVFLEEIRDASIGAISHQTYPYGELIKKLGAGTPDRNPLFDVMFAYQGETANNVLFGDQPAELLPVPITTSKYDFTFSLMPDKGRVVLMAEYSTDLYRENTIIRFISGYKRVLEQMLKPDTLLKNISVLGQEEERRLRFDFNNTGMDYPEGSLVHTLFEEQAARTPDNTALIACDATLTYAQLNEQANRIAKWLACNGVKTGDIVALVLPRKSCLVAAILGILKAGAAYLPIAPDYPKERIDYMLGESNARYCIDESNIQTLLSCANTDIPLPTQGIDLFCALHTSGSTGKPKLSLLRHKGMVNFFHANKRFYENADTSISTTIVTFDAFFIEVIFPLISGIKVIIACEDEIYNQIRFESLFRFSYRNILFSTPVKLESYLENSRDKLFLKRVSSLVVGGEIFVLGLLDKIRKYAHAISIYNAYGPAETTIAASVDDISHKDDITIGRPIANVQMYIVDKYMRLAPIGTIGEICIAGAGVGAGYLNRPDLTAENFIANPFGAGTLYKTGDLGYWREDGRIVYVGRKDFQVKVRGLRIEPAEIESAICAVNGVSQAVVVVRKDNSGHQIICAFYTALEPVPVEKIRATLMARLPRYMIPHHFTHLHEIPLTTTGKIDRKKLPEVDWTGAGASKEYMEPIGTLEKHMARIMEEVLEYAPIGRYDSFFELGGDSLKAIEFICRAHTEGLYIELQNIFDYPTVKELSEFIELGNKNKISYAAADFKAVENMLANNSVERIVTPDKVDMGNILLAGATGYLGSHILEDFLEHDSGIAWCLVRGRDEAESRQRLAATLEFYFGSRYRDMRRIRVLSGDLEKDRLGLSRDDYANLLASVDTVINAAGSVKHFGSYRYFHEANVESVERLIQFCLDADAKLIQISTLSVSGNNFADSFDIYVSDTEKHFYERNLYIGQSLDNVYARSKFEVELRVLEAMSDKGLKANIMRMGNLTNRLSDGKFQKNHESNAFLSRVKGILELGVFPDYLLDLYAEFTPVDEAAKAVMTIARHFSPRHTAFHINSTKVVYLDKLIDYFRELGFHLEIVDGKEFTRKLRDSAEQKGTKFIFEAFINDMNADGRLNYDSNIRIENDFTVQYLRKIGFEWSEIGMEYLRKYVEYFKEIEVLN